MDVLVAGQPSLEGVPFLRFLPGRGILRARRDFYLVRPFARELM